MTSSADPMADDPGDTAAEQHRVAALADYDIVGAPADDPAVTDLAAVCELAAMLVGTSSAVVNLIDDQTQHQIAAFGVDPVSSPRDESLCETTLAAGHDAYLSDARTDPRYADSPWVDGRRGAVRLYTSTLLRTPGGHAIGSLCVWADTVRDLTPEQVHGLQILAQQVVDRLELRRRTRQLERLNAELARSQDRLATFAGQISHDLKAPITAILGFTELLSDLDVITDDPSAAAYVGRCTSAARRMLAMIEDLLAFARVGGTLNQVPVALDSVLPEVLADLGNVATDATITWSGPDVVADRAQLRALLQNLVHNALTYRGDAAGEVEVQSEPVDEGVAVRVIDHGPGIPAESREDVVRPLFRLRKDLPGAGLGLAVCTRITAAHGGSLRIDETPGGGATVSAVFADTTPGGPGSG